MLLYCDCLCSWPSTVILTSPTEPWKPRRPQRSPRSQSFTAPPPPHTASLSSSSSSSLSHQRLICLSSSAYTLQFIWCITSVHSLGYQGSVYGFWYVFLLGFEKTKNVLNGSNGRHCLPRLAPHSAVPCQVLGAPAFFATQSPL